MKMHRCWSPSSVTMWTGYTPETFLGADDKFHYLRNAKLETVFESQTARGKERRPAVVVKRSQSNFWILKKQIFFFFFFKKDSSYHGRQQNEIQGTAILLNRCACFSQPCICFLMKNITTKKDKLRFFFPQNSSCNKY